MKTSLVFLLLLAAVACAAPQAGEEAEGKREEVAEEKREEVAEEKREEVAEEKREEVAEEKREEVAEEAAADTELAAGAEENRQYYPYLCQGPCFCGWGLACLFDGCYRRRDFCGWVGPCACCVVSNPFQCYGPAKRAENSRALEPKAILGN